MYLKNKIAFSILNWITERLNKYPELLPKIEEARATIEEVRTTYNPAVYLVGLSGGGDSMTVLYICKLLELHYFLKGIKIEFQPFHANTGIGIERTRIFCRSICLAMGYELLEMVSESKSYKEIVLDIGFPSAGQHSTMYAMLKERAIRQIKRNYPLKENKAIITGVRANESARRKINVTKQIDKRGRAIWASIIMSWTDEDKEDLKEALGIPTNPVSKCMGMSGECLCGAYANREKELPLIKQVEPRTYNYIMDLEKQVKSKGFTWGWGENPPTGKAYIDLMEKIKPGYRDKYLQKQVEKVRKKTGQLNIFQHITLCSGCESKASLDRKKTKYLKEYKKNDN